MNWTGNNQIHQRIKELEIRKISIFSKLQNRTAVMGFLFAILAAAFSALPNVIPKSLIVEHSVDLSIIPNPMMLVFVIYVVNSLLFSPFRKSDRKSSNTKTGRRTLILLILLGVAESSGTLSYTMGLQETNATNASILVNTETIFAIIAVTLTIYTKMNS